MEQWITAWSAPMKAGSIILWLFAAYNLLSPLPGAWATLVNTVAALILLIHLFEAGTLLTRHRDKTTNLGPDLIQVLLFGVFHLIPLTRRTPTD